ncbi:MAG: Ryanodine receptor Ryr [Ruminiclostridium sp.]|nr:Ryanodine receptor Ryr [Ruminiclostridium sp.]
MKYEPNPVDLSGIQLTPELQADVERIAEDIHETWALQRQREGWTYGPKHDALKKTHPCMVDYASLPEREKDVDRGTVLQTIRMLLWMGYDLKK